MSVSLSYSLRETSVEGGEDPAAGVQPGKDLAHEHHGGHSVAARAAAGPGPPAQLELVRDGVGPLGLDALAPDAAEDVAHGRHIVGGELHEPQEVAHVQRQRGEAGLEGCGGGDV